MLFILQWKQPEKFVGSQKILNWINWETIQKLKRFGRIKTCFMVSFFELDLPLDVMVISQYCRVDTQRGVTQQIVLLKMKQLSINYSSNDNTCISVPFNCVYLWQSDQNYFELSKSMHEYVMFTSTRWQFSKILPQRDYFSAKFKAGMLGLKCWDGSSEVLARAKDVFIRNILDFQFWT